MIHYPVGRETGRNGGGRCTGGGRTGGGRTGVGKRDSQGSGKREKKGKITQHCAIFRNRINAKGREPKNTGREPGLKGTGSGRFKPPCPPPPPIIPKIIVITSKISRKVSMNVLFKVVFGLFKSY